MTAKKATPTPSETVDAEIEAEDLRRELLADMPDLRPAERFRLSHRTAFNDLRLNALAEGVFGDVDDDTETKLEFNFKNPDDIKRYQKLQRFVVSIDEWAETIAEDKEAYAEWAEGKDVETFMALFATYSDALGESKRSGN